MSRMNGNTRNTYLTERKCWMTERRYMNAHALKHGKIALVAHGWFINWSLTSGLCVVATKPAAKLPTSQGWRPLR